MAKLNMAGPFELTLDDINENVTKTSAGNYALGYVRENGVFVVQYVGRADQDVALRLKQHVKESYSHFKFSYASSPRNAFLKECENYHDFGGKTKLKNKYHPDRPEGTNWKCPNSDCNELD